MENPAYLEQTATRSPDQDTKADPSRKRKKDGSEVQTRTKRNRYISIACNECKRRKIRCNGQVPCQRCGNMSLQCVYAPNCCSTGFKDSNEYQAMNQTIQNLQDQVHRLYTDLTALRPPHDSSTSPYPNPPTYPHHPSMVSPHSEGPYHTTSPPASSSRVRHRRFQGPTSSAFNIDVANSSLQTMGLTDPNLIESSGHTYERVNSISPEKHHAPNLLAPSHYGKDPIWSIAKDEAIRLCRVYDEEIGMMYPMLDIELIVERANKLFNSTENVTGTGSSDRTKLSADKIHGSEIDILKMILATTLTLEGDGQSELGSALFDTVRVAWENKLGEPIDIQGLRLLVIMAQYHFQQSAENQAYRTIGLAARLSFELGLHRNNVLRRNFAEPDERSWALKLFWSIFVLDRRWSFGTGLPFAIQDADIDPLLPEPDGSTLYLTAMIAYCRIASKVWRTALVGAEGEGEVQEDTMGYLDYQILQWQNTIPDSLRFYPTVDIPDTGAPSRAQHRLQVLLYLRMNQMRICIYRPVLQSATRIMENRRYASVVVEVAKDTIRVLSRLNQTTDIYRAQQICFNHFLLSALVALYLAVTHAPLEFNQTVRDEFYMAIGLVGGFSAQSYVSMRLWQTIKEMKEIGPKLGLVNRQALSDAIDPHSSAAVAMAGLAGHRVDEMTAFPVTQGPTAMTQTPMNGQQMSLELTNLFEAAGGYHNAMVPSSNQIVDHNHAFAGGQGPMNHSSNGDRARGAGPQGTDREFSRIMQALY